MLSRKAAHSALSGTPRGATSCSLPNQRSAALAFDFWLASVLGLAPTTAGCSRSMLNRAAVKRAGKVAIGLPMALAIWRSAEVHCARCCGDSSAACSIDLTASAKDGSRRAGLVTLGGRPWRYLWTGISADVFKSNLG